MSELIQCRTCLENKEKEDFYLYKKGTLRQPCKFCTNEDNKTRYKTTTVNKNQRRNYSLMYKFGITRDQYDELFERQNGCCFICERHQSKFNKALCVDHAHGESPWVPKGAIRGLLCDNCNRQVIGRNTNADIYEKAALYLRQHTGWIAPTRKKKTKKRKPVR